jgi:nicotinamide mononucleotide transporter
LLLFICGIAFGLLKGENILVYPTGLIATIITVYLLYQAGYVGDMLINAYFSVMSICWYKWSRKTQEEDNLPISRTNKKKNYRIVLFFVTIFVGLGSINYSIMRFIMIIILIL